MIAIVGIGSNLGSRYALVRAAVLSIRTRFAHARCSPFYLSPALALDGVAAGPDYVNAAVRFTTKLSLPELLVRLQAMENHFGRVRRHRWADRTLDLDILWASESCDDPQVPHPECLRRAFALAPLLDVAAERVPTEYQEALTGLGGPPKRCPEPVVWSAPGRVLVHRALDSSDALALAAGHTAARDAAAGHTAAGDAAAGDAAAGDTAAGDAASGDTAAGGASAAGSTSAGGHMWGHTSAASATEDTNWQHGSELGEGDEFNANEETVFFAGERLFRGAGARWRVARVGLDFAEVERVEVR